MGFRSRLKRDADRVRDGRAARGQTRQPADPNASPLAGVKVKDAATQVMVDNLAATQVSTRQQLDILRKTRGQREVGTVKIPPHLRDPMLINVSGGKQSRNSPDGVELRATLAGGDPEE